eukprot:SAG11_NODE_4412_length_1907_cov_22.596792_1_plen_340_part_00
MRLRALIFLAQDIDNIVRMETLQEKYARLKAQQEESSEEESSEEESSEEEDGPEPEKTETLQEKFARLKLEQQQESSEEESSDEEGAGVGDVIAPKPQPVKKASNPSSVKAEQGSVQDEEDEDDEEEEEEEEKPVHKGFVKKAFVKQLSSEDSSDEDISDEPKKKEPGPECADCGVKVSYFEEVCDENGNSFIYCPKHLRKIRNRRGYTREELEEIRIKRKRHDKKHTRPNGRLWHTLGPQPQCLFGVYEDLLLHKCVRLKIFREERHETGEFKTPGQIARSLGFHPGCFPKEIKFKENRNEYDKCYIDIILGLQEYYNQQQEVQQKMLSAGLEGHTSD